MNFHQSFLINSAALSLQTSENNLKPHWNHFNHEQLLEGATYMYMYINLMVKFSGASLKYLWVFFVDILKILIGSDKIIHKAFSVYKTL